MTQKQIDKAKKTLPDIATVPWCKWTKKEKKLEAELNCREMINSCLAYGGIQDFWDYHSWCRPDRTLADKYIRDLGEDRIREIAAEQEADFSKALVQRGVATDFEGNSYNRIIWADEIRMV